MHPTCPAAWRVSPPSATKVRIPDSATSTRGSGSVTWSHAASPPLCSFPMPVLTQLPSKGVLKVADRGTGLCQMLVTPHRTTTTTYTLPSTTPESGSSQDAGGYLGPRGDLEISELYGRRKRGLVVVCDSTPGGKSLIHKASPGVDS